MTVGYFQQGTVFFLQVQRELLNVDFQKKSAELRIEIIRLQQINIRNENYLEYMRKVVLQTMMDLFFPHSPFLP